MTEDDSSTSIDWPKLLDIMGIDLFAASDSATMRALRTVDKAAYKLSQMKTVHSLYWRRKCEEEDIEMPPWWILALEKQFPQEKLDWKKIYEKDLFMSHRCGHCEAKCREDPSHPPNPLLNLLFYGCSKLERLHYDVTGPFDERKKRTMEARAGLFDLRILLDGEKTMAEFEMSLPFPSWLIDFGHIRLCGGARYAMVTDKEERVETNLPRSLHLLPAEGDSPLYSELPNHSESPSNMPWQSLPVGTRRVLVQWEPHPLSSPLDFTYHGVLVGLPRAPPLEVRRLLGMEVEAEEEEVHFQMMQIM